MKSCERMASLQRSDKIDQLRGMLKLGKSNVYQIIPGIVIFQRYKPGDNYCVKITLQNISKVTGILIKN